MRKLAFVLLFAACGGDNHSPDAGHAIDAPKTVDAPQAIDAPQTIDAPLATTTTFSLGSGGANALLWDASASTLYVTDEDSNTLRAITFAGGSAAETTLEPLPTVTAGVSPGGMLELADKSILIASFGFGTQGSVFHAPAGSGQTVVNLSGLDATRRRIGLAADGSGALYSSYFVKTGSTFTGGVSSLTLAGSAAAEVEIAGSNNAAGFQKVVGIAATADAIFVSDQSAKTIFKVALPGGTVSTLASGLPTADLLLMLPNGDMLTGGGSAVTRVTQQGVVSAQPAIGTTFEDVHGMAYDPAGHRLFVVDHSTTAATDTLYIVPFTP